MKFTHSLLVDDGTVLKPSTRNLLFENQLPQNTFSFYWGARFDNFRYGLGWDLPQEEYIDEHVIWHEGAGRCAVAIDRKRGFSIVLFVPSDTDWVEESVSIPKEILWKR